MDELIAVDIGNTNITLGLFKDKEIGDRFRISTNRNATTDECFFWLKEMFPLWEQTSGIRSIVCSVVPSLTEPVSGAIERITGKKPLIVSSDLNLGIEILYNPPEDVGADRIANAVAVSEFYQLPAVVIDLGTATTFDIVSGNREYIGGLISPGIETSLSNLFQRAARLFPTDLIPVKSVIGKNTSDAIRAGTLYAAVDGIEGVTDRIESEIGKLSSVIITGGLAEIVSGVLRRDVIVDINITLKGLYKIAERNSQ